MPEADIPQAQAPASGVHAAYAAYVARFNDPAAALLDLAWRAGIAVAYLDRRAIEADTGRALTDAEWDKIAYQLDWYDEHVCGSGDLNGAFLDEVFAAAGVERCLDEGDTIDDDTNSSIDEDINPGMNAVGTSTV